MNIYQEIFAIILDDCKKTHQCVNCTDTNQSECWGQVMSFISKKVRAELRQSVQLSEQLINFIDHGDYSNGNEANGIDEGTTLAIKYRNRLSAKLRRFKEKHGV